MDNETKKMFELLINKIDDLSESVNSMGRSVNSMDRRIDSMDRRIDSMDQRIDSMDQRIDSMDQRLNTMEIRQDEIYSVVKAIEHSNTTHKAEIDNINYRLAHTEGIINNIGKLIVESRAAK